MTSAASAPRCEDGEKKTLRGLPTLAAQAVEGVLLKGAPFHIECRLERVIDGLGEDQLVIGEVVAAHADREALRDPTTPDATRVRQRPLLAYLHPSQFATIDDSTGFPFPKDFTRD